MIRKTILPAFVFLLSFFIGCKKDDLPPVENPGKSSAKDILSFSFKQVNSRHLKEDVICNIGDSIITGILPGLNIPKDSLIASFTVSPNAVVQVNNVLQASDTTLNDYSKPLMFKVIAEDSSVKEYRVFLKRFTGLPIVYINTENNQPVVSKDDYINASLKIEANDLGNDDYEGTTMIRGRGNSTWSMPKKPYKLKLSQKSKILGMPADKEWGLLANYIDRSLVRNSVAFEVSKMFNMPYTPRSKFVEVVFNGEYAGNYLLTELAKISSDRVDIKELDEDDISEQKISGGYRLEVDARLDEVNWFITTKGAPFTIKEPDFGIQEHNSYIRNYIQQTEDVLYSDSFANTVSGYSAYLDPDTFIKWFWVNELFKNNDATFFSSVLMYKDRGKRLCMGPVWDFDLGAGNTISNNNDNPEGWWVKNSIWISRLFEDSLFAKKAVDKWKSVRADITMIPFIIDNFASSLYLSRQENFKKWDIWQEGSWFGIVGISSYEEEIAHLKSWLIQRILWIDNNVDQLMPLAQSENAVFNNGQ